ncbi:serine hydrolase domain-containing protein [Bacteroidota bacterium]
MKRRHISITSCILFLAIFSCTKYPDPWITVDTCTFSETTGNATNPYTTLYQDILDDFVKSGIPGLSVAIKTPEYGWWVGCAGLASIEDKIAMRPCHLHNSASMAKTYTATMIMRLYEEGKLDLDDLASNYLSEDIVSGVANADKVSIRQLLNHTSGMGASYNSELRNIDFFNNPITDYSIDAHFEKYVYRQPAEAAPGEEYNYKDINYALLGLIVENVSDMSIGDYLDQEIIEPLGLVNTYYWSSPGYPDRIPYLVNSYFELFPGQIQNCTDISLSLRKSAIGFTGIYASPYEFGRFVQELMRGNIVDPGTLEIMLEDEQINFEFRKYGLGIMHWHDIMDFDDSYGHAGGGRSSSSIMMYFPDTDVTVAFAYNLGMYFISEKMESLHNDLTVELLSVTFFGERANLDE